MHDRLSNMRPFIAWQKTSTFGLNNGHRRVVPSANINSASLPRRLTSCRRSKPQVPVGTCIATPFPPPRYAPMCVRFCVGELRNANQRIGDGTCRSRLTKPSSRLTMQPRKCRDAGRAGKPTCVASIVGARSDVGALCSSRFRSVGPGARRGKPCNGSSSACPSRVSPPPSVVTKPSRSPVAEPQHNSNGRQRKPVASWSEWEPDGPSRVGASPGRLPTL
jgi:hypothetical protein